jgi:hypothetical protein
LNQVRLRHLSQPWQVAAPQTCVPRNTE